VYWVYLQDLSALDDSSSSSSSGQPGPGVVESELSGSHRHIAELLLEQVEVADVLLLNKADTVSGEDLKLMQV
jgi:G3E family GTPase